VPSEQEISIICQSAAAADWQFDVVFGSNQAKYDQHRDKVAKLAQAMNGTRTIHVLMDGTVLNADDSANKKILSEPSNDIRPSPSVVIPALRTQNGRESYYRFV